MGNAAATRTADGPSIASALNRAAPRVQRAARGSLGPGTLQRHALRDPLRASSGVGGPIQRVTEVEARPLREAEDRISKAIDKSALEKARFVAGIPSFVDNEVQVPIGPLTLPQVTTLAEACRRYLLVFNTVQDSAEFRSFQAKFVDGPMGRLYETFAADTNAVKTNLAVAQSGELDDDSKVLPRVNACKTALQNLVGLGVAQLGGDLEGAFPGGAGANRNRGAGAEVTAVDQMLALGALVPDKVTGIYKSEYDQAAGNMGAEWTVRSGAITNHIAATTVVNRLAGAWVLHAHVSDARGNYYNKQVESLNADHFHLKDKATAQGGDGPSVIVGTARVRNTSEALLKSYFNAKKPKERADLITAGYVQVTKPTR